VTHVLYWMKRAQLAVRRTMDDELQQYGLTSAQAEILGPVAHSVEGISHKELAEWLGVASPTLTNSIDTLIEKGLVERRVSPNDARAKRIFATDAGRAVMAQLIQHANVKVHALLAGFDAQDLAQFSDYLQRLARNAGDSLEVPDEVRRRVEEARRQYDLPSAEGVAPPDEC
jgi:MarR family transcriptional regulator, transcriptional regulator for hemolysin